MRSVLYAGLFFLTTVSSLRSQELPTDGPRRFELGTKVADVRTGCIGSVGQCYLPSFGIGVSGAMNITPHFAVDADYLATPQTTQEATNLAGGHASELLVGVRTEVRAKHYGYFIKAQPGYFRWSNVITDVYFPTPRTFAFHYGPRTHFVTNLGVGAEYSLGSRFHIRGEVTDVLMRYTNTSWTHNLQPSIGVYAGLGRPLQWTAPIYDDKVVHPFWNPTNSTLIATSLMASMADAVTTQNFLKRGLQEGDPFARPLVKYGWSGQISITSLEIGGEILVMHSLHRMRQHWIERILPAGITLTHGILAYNNTNIRVKNPTP